MGIPYFTARDALDHLQITEGGLNQDAQLTIGKSVIRDAYTDLMAQYPWTFGQAEYQLTLNDDYSTGTIVYDHSGGSSERLVTLTTGTVPSNAASCRLRIGTATYKVDRYLSSSTFTLDAVLNPGADVASTSDWKLYQTNYDLPDDFHSFEGFIEGANAAQGSYLTPAEWIHLDRVTQLSGTPFHWTILPSVEAGSEGKMAVRITGYPTSSSLISFLYRQQPVAPKWVGVETYATQGTVATAGTVTVTGTSTNFVASMNGAVIRIGDATNAPTGDDGLYPWTEERRIREVASTTSLTSTVAFSNTVSSYKYVISSLLPLPLVARNAYKAGLEYFMALYQKDAAIQLTKARRYREAMVLAMAAESRNTERKMAARPVPDPAFYGTLPHVIDSRSS